MHCNIVRQIQLSLYRSKEQVSSVPQVFPFLSCESNKLRSVYLWIRKCMKSCTFLLRRRASSTPPSEWHATTHLSINIHSSEKRWPKKFVLGCVFFAPGPQGKRRNYLFGQLCIRLEKIFMYKLLGFDTEDATHNVRLYMRDKRAEYLHLNYLVPNQCFLRLFQCKGKHYVCITVGI